MWDWGNRTKMHPQAEHLFFCSDGGRSDLGGHPGRPRVPKAWERRADGQVDSLTLWKAGYLQWLTAAKGTNGAGLDRGEVPAESWRN